MKYIASLFLSSLLFLTACTPIPSTSPHGGGHMQGGTANARALTIQDESSSNEIAFAVWEGNDIFIDYGISHTKEMHLIVVRDDLRNFQHLHPERDSEGIWRIPFTPTAGGTYWLYADFVEKNEASHTIRFQRTYESTVGAHGIEKSDEKVKTVDGYRFELPSVPTVHGDTLSFVYLITDTQGNHVPVEEYLGATGHSVLISPSGDFIHAHATESDYSDPEFLVPMPKENYYRAFTQFQIKGRVITVNFDWQS